MGGEDRPRGPEQHAYFPWPLGTPCPFPDTVRAFHPDGRRSAICHRTTLLQPSPAPCPPSLSPSPRSAPSVLNPAAASAASVGGVGTALAPDAHPNYRHHHGDDRTGSLRSRRHQHHTAAQLRPMSSGEEQYRTGCRQGYITEGRGAFSLPGQLSRGINPSL